MRIRPCYPYVGVATSISSFKPLPTWVQNTIIFINIYIFKKKKTRFTGRVSFRRAVVPDHSRAYHLSIPERVTGYQSFGCHTPTADTQRTLGIEQRRRIVARKNWQSKRKRSLNYYFNFHRFQKLSFSSCLPTNFNFNFAVFFFFYRVISATFTRRDFGPRIKKSRWKRVGLPCRMSTKRNSCRKVVFWNNTIILTLLS